MSSPRTGRLLAGMAGLCLAVGFMLGSEMGVAMSIVLAIGINTSAYWRMAKVVLWVEAAREVDARYSSGPYRAVETPAWWADRRCPASM